MAIGREGLRDLHDRFASTYKVTIRAQFTLDREILLHGNWKRRREKALASAGNRTRAARVAGEHSTTEPPMPTTVLAEAGFALTRTHSSGYKKSPQSLLMMKLTDRTCFS